MKRFFYLMAAAVVLTANFISCKRSGIKDPENNTVSTKPHQMTMTTAKTSVELGLIGGDKAVVDWGDGQMDTYTLSADISTRCTHSYSDETSRTIKVIGNCITVLECVGDSLTSIDVSCNAALTTLYCHNNQLTSLDVNNNILLTGLLCGWNELTSLNVSSNTALEILLCEKNVLTSLGVSSNTALTELWCYDNQLTSLDVSSNIELVNLGCSDNHLTSLDVSSNIALKELNCSWNSLTSLDLSNNTALQRLDCFMNHITSEALDALFNTLPDRTDLAPNGTIYIAGHGPNTDGSGVTDCDQSIATGKNWTVDADIQE